MPNRHSSASWARTTRLQQHRPQNSERQACDRVRHRADQLSCTSPAEALECIPHQRQAHQEQPEQEQNDQRVDQVPDGGRKRLQASFKAFNQRLRLRSLRRHERAVLRLAAFQARATNDLRSVAAFQHVASAVEKETTKECTYKCVHIWLKDTQH